MNAESGLEAGGIVGLVIAVGYAIKELHAWWQAKHASDTTAEVTPVANAATANEMALATLAAVASERSRLEDRLDEVEAKAAALAGELERTREEARVERLKREAQAKRLDAHDREIGHIKRQFVLAVTYIRSLLAFITDHGLSDDAPKPPSGLSID